MKNTLYRIEPTMKMEEPELNGSVVIMCNGGTVFAELHPVKIKAKAKGPCKFCTLDMAKVGAMASENGKIAVEYVRPRYCFNCGRRLPNVEE